MKRVLEDIQSGRFARDWMLENKVNQASFKATRRRNAEHPIEQVGEKLRAMMPWIAKNKLVDKTRNSSGRAGAGGPCTPLFPPRLEVVGCKGNPPYGPYAFPVIFENTCRSRFSCINIVKLGIFSKPRPSGMPVSGSATTFA